MSHLPARLRVYLYSVIGASALSIVLALQRSPHPPGTHGLVIAGLLVGLSLLAYLAPVTLAPGRQLVLLTSLQAIALVALQPGLAGAAIALSVLLGNLYRGRRPLNTLFNTAQVALAVVVAGTLYHALMPAGATVAAGGRGLAALLLSGLALFLVSSLAVDAVAAIQRRRPLLADWWTLHRTALCSHMVMVALGGATAAAIQRSPWLALVTVAPVIIVRAMLHRRVAFDTHVIELAMEVADALDARHAYLRGASQRIGELVERVARAHGLSKYAVRRVTLAALLHNIAAADLPDYIELGTARLDEHQKAFWRNHPGAGADLIFSSLGLGDVAEVLRCHHERMDGKGYPEGLHGADIPLDARVLSVCEGWVALTSDRGYRPAMPYANAWLVMQAGAGTQWDPDVVQTLARVIAAEQSDASPASGPDGLPAPGTRPAVA
jgi:HD-GYP domain-containing protein (c-di-GMP phosphodiesterase class II)